MEIKLWKVLELTDDDIVYRSYLGYELPPDEYEEYIKNEVNAMYRALYGEDKY